MGNDVVCCTDSSNQTSNTRSASQLAIKRDKDM